MKHIALLNKVLSSKKDTLNFCVLGGSITEGASATEVSDRYANRVFQYLKTANPNKEINFINKGIGATGSNIGVFRLRNDIINSNPDILIVEFAVNDTFHTNVVETYEGIFRQMQLYKPECAIIALCTTYEDFKTAEDKHRTVANHYQVPMVSVRDIVKKRVEKGEMKWSDYATDNCHPTSLGHKMLADLVIDLIKNRNTKEELLTGSFSKLVSDKYDHTTLLHANDLRPTIKKGWWSCNNWYFGERLEADYPGSVLEFDFVGNSLSLIYKKFPGDFGKIKITVDKKHETILDGHFEQAWGGYSVFQEIAPELSHEKHHVKIEILKDKHNKSNGNRFQIEGICITHLKQGA